MNRRISKGEKFIRLNNHFFSTIQFKKLLSQKYLSFPFRLIILIGSFFSFSPVFSQTTLFYTDFENTTSTFAANGWNVVNPGTNNWYVGTTEFYAGNRGAYISNNGGTNNNYRKRNWENAHFYKDVIIPAGATGIALSFTYKGIGEAGWDKLLVYTAPTTVTPTTSYPVMWDEDLPGANLVFKQTGTESSWVTESASLPNSLAGTTVRLIFTWQNDDNIGSNPAAAVDNISLAYCQKPTVAGATTNTCIGGSTGTITASASGGPTPYTYSLNGGTYQSSAIFTGLGTGTYTLYVKSNCGSVGSASVNITAFQNSTGSQAITATNSWIGHIYDGTNFEDYKGYFTEAETFDENFGGISNCFDILSHLGTSSINTETFSVKYRMNSSKKGLYVADLGSDDGSRLTVDGIIVYNNWALQSFSIRPAVLMNLTGTSTLLYEFYENVGGNRVIFQNLTLLLENKLSVNTTQTICTGSTGSVISGDNFGSLPSGISKSGTGFQWHYSTTPGGVKTDIPGATGASFTPSPSISPFNTSGTYYVYRKATLTSSNNVSPSSITLTNVSNAVTIIIEPAGSWTGAAGTDWSNTGNWGCAVLPTSLVDVTIPTGLVNYPIINSDGIAKNITLQNGTSLTVNGVFHIYGSINNNSGVFNAINGTMEVAANVAQAIPGNSLLNNSVNHLIINNSSATGVIISEPLNIYGSLSYIGTGRKLETNDQLTLKSTTSNTAWVGDMTGNSLTGKVTVERYISAHKAWRFLSVPTNTTQTINAAWQEGGTGNTDNPVPGYGAQLTGPGGIAAVYDLYTALPSIKTYNSLANGWDAIPNTNTTNIKSTEGYMIFIRGNRTSNAYNSAVTETVLRTKGTLYIGNTGPVSIIPDKMASVGNPYAAPIDFTKITRTAGVDNKFYVWDPFIYGYYQYGGYQLLSAANNWEPVPGGSVTYPTGVPNATIQSGQAFFVHATTTGTFDPDNYKLYFEENDKIDGSGLVSFAKPQELSGTTSPRQFFRVSLYTGPSSNDVIADGNAVAFDENFSNEIDGDDALKIATGGENFDVKRNSKLLAVEAKSLITENDTIYYNMSKLAAKTYQLRFAPVNMASSGLEALLIDKFLNSNTPVSLIDSSFINITITADAASAAADRFKVVFRSIAVLPVTITSVNAFKENENILVTWKVENESNLKQYEVEKSVDGNHFSKIGTVEANDKANYYFSDNNVVSGYNYYRIRSVDKDGAYAFSQIIKVLADNGHKDITVSPNPIANGTINLQLTNQPKGIYYVRLLNSLGQTVISKKLIHTGDSSIESLRINNRFGKGIYHLEINTPDGGVKFIKVVN